MSENAKKEQRVLSPEDVPWGIDWARMIMGLRNDIDRLQEESARRIKLESRVSNLEHRPQQIAPADKAELESRRRNDMIEKSDYLACRLARYYEPPPSGPQVLEGEELLETVRWARSIHKYLLDL